MNRKAEQHLTRAVDYAAKGEEYFRKCADEIAAAMAADPTIGARVVAERMGRTRDWVGALVRWRTNGYPGKGPFASATAEEKGRGVVEARRVLREAPPERIAEMLDTPEVRANGPVLGKSRLAELSGVDERSIPGAMQWMRNNAPDVGRLATAQQVNGTWAYGWCDTLDDHYQEHYKRRVNDLRRIKVSIKTLEQSLVEHPDDFSLHRQLVNQQGMQGQTEQDIAELGRICRALSAERRQAA